LGLSPAMFSVLRARQRRGKVNNPQRIRSQLPYKEALKYCEDRNICVDWLLSL